MWIKNSNTNVWQKDNEKLNKNVYNLMRQELKKVRFYSKCLDGTSYLALNSLDNIYDKLQYTNKDSWYLGSTTYSIPAVGDNEITTSTLDEYNNYILEGGMTLKNLFTDEKVINDSIDNYLEVDLITTKEILNLTSSKKGLIIDNIRVKEKHRVLVKEQKTYITLSNTIDPNVYFNSNYYITDSTSSTIDYFFYNNENGIYVYQNNHLVKTNELDNYETNMRYSVVAKLGNDNFDKQFHLSRLKSGFYPISKNNEPIEFLEKHNWILRNKLEYQNVLDVNYNDTLKHLPSSFGSYSIPERTISVGDFGSIISNQNGKSVVVKSKYKGNLNSVDEIDGYYLACGEDGTLLKISKVDFSIKSIDLDTFQTLNSVSFFNDSRGVVVGDYNTIYNTFDGGVSWKKIEVADFDGLIYNDAIYYSLTTFYIVGNNGIFLEFIYNNGQWLVNKRRPIKKVNQNDEFYVVDDIKSIIKADFNNWSLNYNFATSSVINVNKESLLMVGDNNTLFFYDVNNFIPNEDYLFISMDNNLIQNDLGNLKTVAKRNNDIYLYSSDRKEGYNLNINSFNTINSNTNILTATNSLLVNNTALNGNYNKFYNFNNNELILVGDNSTLNGYTYSATSIFNLDQTFGINFDSKMLFMDYDIASKLNFFDNNSNYRLPSEFSIESSPNLTTTSLSINSIVGEKSWIDYMKDENKVFQYNTAMTTANQVLISSNFTSFATGSSASNNISIPNGVGVTKDLNLITNLAPSFISTTASIIAPTASFGLYLYEDIMILKTAVVMTPVSLGDVFGMNSNIVDGTFVVNRIEDFGIDRYIYFYSNFNQNIINDLDIIAATISFTNLNKFEVGNENMLSKQFNKHPIGVCYESIFSENFNILTDKFQIKSIFNEKTAYYNLQANVNFQGVTSSITDMKYSSSFIDFGFSPTYNLKDYLFNIDSALFTSNKIFGSMPVYLALPSNNASVDISLNKLVFNPGYKFEYDTFWENTFIDITVYGISTVSTFKSLILKKYYDSNIDRYIIELSKEINKPTTPTFIDIKSRRTLGEISSDLRELNNIQKGTKKVSFGANLFYNLENELNSKFNTENYTKIFLSDSDIKSNLTSIVYIDNSNKLSMNIINLGEKVEAIINGISNSFGNVEFQTTTVHKLSVGDYVYVEDVDKIYAGIHIVKSITNNNKFVSKSYWIGISTGSGLIKHNIFDEYLNYEPSDIIDVGIDLKGSISVSVNPINIRENKDNTISIINLDLNKFKFKLIDNLSVVDVSKRHKWILEAEIEDAVIGQDNNGNIQWYTGIWNCGRWLGGDWYQGIFRNGYWYKGNFHSVDVMIDPLHAKPNIKSSDKKFSIWYNGVFKDGIWINGTHNGGDFDNSSWKNGLFSKGRFRQSVWENGEFSGGEFISSTWNNGILNSNNGLSTFIDSSFNGGDFENGMWINSTFNQKSGKLSRFGTKSTNSRKAIWKSGKYLMGEFHSFLNRDDNGNTISSINHKYSIFETGIWNNGSFYGGTAYNINFNSGTWYDGIVNEIFVLGVLNLNNIPAPPLGKENTILLRGIWNFNRNDTFWIIDNQVGIEPTLGSNDNPMKYTVKGINIIKATNPSEKDLTEVFVFQDISTVNGFGYSYSSIPGNVGWKTNPIVNSNHSVVSLFERTDWKSGLFMNGIFKSNSFISGMFLNGVFNGNWG